MRAYKRELQQRADKPRLDDVLDDRTSGQFGTIRLRLRDNDRGARARSEFLRDRYEQSTEDYNDDMRDTLERLREVSESVVSEEAGIRAQNYYDFLICCCIGLFCLEQTIQAENEATCDERTVEVKTGQKIET